MRTHAAIAPAVFASLIPLWGLAFAGCGGAADESSGLEAYFVAEPYANPACNVVDKRLTGTREVRLFVHGDVDLLSATQGLARYYHRHSLSFVTSAQPEVTTMSYAIDTDQAGLMKAIVAAFPDVDFEDDSAMADPALLAKVQTFIARHMFGPLIDFTTTHASGTNVTNLVVLPNVENPVGSSTADPGTSLAGLSVSPALVAEFTREMGEDQQLWEEVNLPAGFTPVVILGNDVLAQQTGSAAVIRDLTVAHEFGHSAGLPHMTTDKRNLMYPVSTPGLNDCTDSLTGAQLDTMATTLDLSTAAASSALVAAQTEGAPSLSATARGRAGLPSSFTPARLRAVMAGDGQAMRALVDSLIHPERSRN